MPAGRVVIEGFMPALSLAGNPIPGAKLTFYANETTTLIPVYTDPTLTVAHPNPVIADAGGQFPSIFADPGIAFTVSLKDGDGATVGFGSRDNVRAIGEPGAPSDEQVEMAVGTVLPPLIANKADQADLVTLEGAVTVASGVASDALEAATVAGGIASDALEAATVAGGLASDALEAATIAGGLASDAFEAATLAGGTANDALAAVTGKADLAGDTFTGDVVMPSSKVGDSLQLTVSGGEPAPAFVVDFNNFKLAPASTISETATPVNPAAAYAADSVDVDRRRAVGYGKDYFDKIIIQSGKRTFGWLNEAIDFAVLTNAPASGEVWVDNLGVYRPVTAEIKGAIPPNVVAVYEGGFESLCGFFRNFGTEVRRKAVSSYTRYTVTFVDPLEPDEFYPTMFYETDHSPPFRGQGQTISSDRRTVTMHAWYAAGNGADGQIPSGTPDCKINPNYQAYIFNSIAQLDDERWVLAATPTTAVTGGTSLGSWDASANSPTITSGSGTSGNYYTVSVAGSTTINGVSSWAVGERIRYNGSAWVKVVRVRHRDQEEVFTTWEIGMLNNRGALNYNGTGPSKGQVGRENFVSGIDFVNNGTYPSAYAVRSRGATYRGFVSRDNQDGGFVVEKGELNNTAWGFRTEANHTGFKAIQVAPNEDVRFQVDGLTGNMQIGSKTSAYANLIEFFSSGDSTADASLTVTTGGAVEWDATSFVVRGPSFARQMSLASTGFNLGPSGSEWASYGSGEFRVGPTSDPWIYAQTGGIVLQRSTQIARSGSGAYSMLVTPISGAVNYLEVRGNATGFGPRFMAQGSDTNIDLVFETKGSGKIWLGPVSGSSDVAIAGYMEVKDNFGNVRKLAVIA